MLQSGTAASIGVGFTPAGIYADIYTAVSGEDYFTGDEVSGFWRAAGIVPLVSEVRKGGKIADAASGATLRPYGGPGGGHHVPAQSAFRGAAGYDPKVALAIPNAELARLGVSHSAITGAQMTGYRALAQSGKPLTWHTVMAVEVNALVRGGMSREMARSTAATAIRALKDAGVAGPTRIPWGP